VSRSSLRSAPASQERSNPGAGTDIPETVSASGLAEIVERGKSSQAIRVRELATLLNVSPMTIYRHAKSGGIPSFRVGASLRFDPKMIARWLRNGCWPGGRL
jgi:excisionase family DNA binding protein